MQLMLNRKKMFNTFSVVSRIKPFFLCNICIYYYDALGQVILPLGLSALGQYLLSIMPILDVEKQKY